MIIKHLYVEKTATKYCTENFTLKEALQLLSETGYRAVPVLDQSGQKYLGTIYKVDIYEFLQDEAGSADDSVMKLVEEPEAYIYEESSFYKVLFTIRRLPFIAVLNEDNEYMGILTHSKVMDFLEDSLGIKTNGYTITVVSNEYQGALTSLVSIIKQHCSIESLVTLDSGEKYLRRMVLTLPKGLTDNQMDELVRDVESKGFRVTHRERIQK